MYHEEGLPQREMAARPSLSQSRVGCGAPSPPPAATTSTPRSAAAVRGGWINVLITDTTSAARLAEETYL